MAESRTSKNNGFFSKINKPIFFITVVLIIFGTLSVVSASANESVSRYHYSMFNFFFRHLIMIGGGVAIGSVAMIFPTKLYKYITKGLWFVITCLVVGLFIYGSAKRGATNWIPITKHFSIQPSEFAKPILILAIAVFFESASLRFKKGTMDPWKFTLKWVVLGALIPVVVVLSGDIGTASIILFITGSLYLIGPLDNKDKRNHILILMATALVLLPILGAARGYILTKEQKERLTEFFNPCSKYENSGYQICNCYIAMNDGGLTGVGISKSKQKYSYIPEAYTDSIFAIIVEEDGLIIGLAVLILYFILIVNILKVAKQSKTLRGRYICFGVACYLFAHVAFNIGGLLGLLPYTGVPLPLISYGGSFTISFIAALGVVQRINIENKQNS